MKKALIFISIVFLPLFHIHSQERTDQLYAMYSENSIIRELSQTKWVVYSELGSPSFSVVEDGNPLVDFIFLPKEFKSVSDFTILDNHVYFCGMLHSGVSVMGKFFLYAFPSTTIHYSEITGVDTLTAIKVWDTYLYPPKSTTIHVLMLGKKNNTGIFVDAMSVISGGWNTCYITLRTKDGHTVLHDDIDLLDKYAVLASHNSEQQSPETPSPSTYGTGYVWYIKKPTPPYVHFLTFQEYFSIPYVEPTKQLRLTACEGNACVAAALAYKEIDHSLSPGIHVYGFNYPNNIETIRLVEEIDHETLRDLSYDKSKKKTELLVQYNNATSSDSRIYTLTQATLPWTSVIGRSYLGHKINSLITQSYNSEHFIGSGVDISDHTGLNIYRYKNTNHECSEMIYRNTRDIDRRPKNDGQKTYEVIFHPDITALPIEKKTAIITICE